MTRFLPAVQASDALHALLTAYYREGEDADTPQSELDAFIAYLTELLEQHILMGEIIYEDDMPLGFVLYAKDGEGYPFSECPGMGTIAEIAVAPEARGKGLGSLLVRRAEEALQPSVTLMYICAHDSARGFWEKCGYRTTGRIAGNGLPICVK